MCASIQNYQLIPIPVYYVLHVLVYLLEFSFILYLCTQVSSSSSFFFTILYTMIIIYSSSLLRFGKVGLLVSSECNNLSFFPFNCSFHLELYFRKMFAK